MAIRLHVAGGREHRALPNARLVQDVLLELLLRTPTVKSIANLVHMSPPLTCADAPTASNPPRGLCASRTSCPIDTRESDDLLRLPGGEGHRSWDDLFQPHILIGGRVDIEWDQANPWLRDPRPHATQECQLPVRDKQGLLLYDALDLV
jgi:hypothetical protein